MAITVNFDSPPGVRVLTREFSPGDRIRVSGKVTGFLGIPQAFLKVRLDITDNFSPLYAESYTNYLGNYYFDVTLPDVDGQAKVIITTANEAVSVSIGIGVQAPPPPKPPGTPGTVSLLFPAALFIGAAVTAVLVTRRKR